MLVDEVFGRDEIKLVVDIYPEHRRGIPQKEYAVSHMHCVFT